MGKPTLPRAPRGKTMYEPPRRDRTQPILEYVRKYEKTIYVRELVNEKWQAVAISTLPPSRWAFHVARWVIEGVTPVRVIEEEDDASKA